MLEKLKENTCNYWYYGVQYYYDGSCTGVYAPSPTTAYGVYSGISNTNCTRGTVFDYCTCSMGSN